MTDQSASKVPFRFELQFCAALASADEAEQVLLAVSNAAEKATGLPVELGAIEPMADADIIPDSPLAQELERRVRTIMVHCGRCGGDITAGPQWGDKLVGCPKCDTTAVQK